MDYNTETWFQYMIIEYSDLNYRRLHENFCGYIHDSIRFRSICEIGAGPGAFLESCDAYTDDWYGTELNELLIKAFYERNPDAKGKFEFKNCADLELDRDYDVIVCVEVLEHLNDVELDNLLTQVGEHCNWFFVSTPPDVEPYNTWEGHEGVRDEAEWIEILKGYGLDFVIRTGAPVEWGTLYRGKYRMPDELIRAPFLKEINKKVFDNQ
jgi:2-polyprenyl-3-methyl-5-hydroxy-6-metoxy-1,4-benzoquinol methylase